MFALPSDDLGWPGSPPPADLSALLDAATAAVGQLADAADLDRMADRDAAAVMGVLTTLVGRLDGLRVQVARTVRDRQICGLRGTRNLAGWLRADARLADDAWKIGRLAAAGPELPQITALLDAGTIGLAQAATACWQVAQLPTAPVPPPVIDGDAAAGQPEADATASRPDDDAAASRPDGDVAAGRPDDDTQAGPPDRPGDTGRPGDDADWPAAGEPPDAQERSAGADRSAGGEAWAGLWRAGDVHAAADQLFATFLPGLDAAQLRQLGAHLREAADTQDRAAGDCGDYARRGLRISRSLHGTGEITGRLHAEGAEQVIAAFEQLGGKTGPDDTRTKAQRWADVLTRLAGTAPDLLSGRATRADAASDPAGPDDDQPCDADPHTGHDHDGDHGHCAHACQPGRAGGPDQPGGPVPAAYQRPRMIVTVPLDTLLGRPLAPGATLGPGTPLTAEAARRLACDTEIIRLVTSPQPPPATGRAGHATAQLTALLAAAIAGLPPPLAGPSAVLDIGRQSPGWTPRQRDALHAQYGGQCAAPRCTGPIEVIHHIIHWLHGGKTRIINGFPSCKYHHWLVHEGGWRVKKHRDGTIVLYPPPPGWRPGTIYRNGRPITEHAGPADTS